MTRVEFLHRQSYITIISPYTATRSMSSHGTSQKRQQTLDAGLAPSSSFTTSQIPAKRRRSSVEQGIDIDTYRDDEGIVSIRGKKEINRYLLKTLGRDENPITNSDLYDRYAHFLPSLRFFHLHDTLIRMPRFM
jgi:hypothetical protein